MPAINSSPAWRSVLCVGAFRPPRRTSPIASLRHAFAAANAPVPLNVRRIFFSSRALHTHASTLAPRWRIPVGFLVIVGLPNIGQFARARLRNEVALARLVDPAAGHVRSDASRVGDRPPRFRSSTHGLPVGERDPLIEAVVESP